MANEGEDRRPGRYWRAILTALLRPAQISCRRPYPLLRIVLAYAVLIGATIAAAVPAGDTAAPAPAALSRRISSRPGSWDRGNGQVSILASTIEQGSQPTD